MKKKEFIKGMIIITLLVFGYYVLSDLPITNIEPKVKISQTYSVKAITDENGNVEVLVK